MPEENKTMEELQAEIAQLKAEIAALKSQQEEPAAETEPMTKAAVLVEQTIHDSTDDLDIRVEAYCRWAAARAGAIVIAPLLGTVALMANEVYLVSRIARIYDVKLTERALIAFLGAMGSRMAGTLLTTLIPFSVIQVPVAVGITYSLGKVTQRWMKDGMPSDMTPYIAMMSEWKDRAREQVDKLRENPLKNVPLGDETIDFMKKWGNTAKDSLTEVKEKGQKLYHDVLQRDSLAEEVAAECEKEPHDVPESAPEDGDEASQNPEEACLTEEQIKDAVEDAKIPLDNN